MNVAYKWYSYNNNIIQFYSDSSCSRNRNNYLDDGIKGSIDKTYDYAANVIDTCENINSY